MRGRKPKPLEIKEIEGNPGKRPLKKNSPKSGVDEIKNVCEELKNQKSKKSKEINNKRKPKSGGVEPGTPLCPAWIEKIAKKEWRRVAPVLKKMGLLTVLDRTALAAYCQAYARWRQAEEMINKYNLVYISPKSRRVEAGPFVRIAQKYLEICKNICVEFGMTPSSRGRMLLPGQSEKDELEELIDE